MGQTGSGHFSPIGEFHAARDLVLILDVARFKYPPHWVPTDLLFNAMQPVDPASGKPRGWMTLRRRASGSAFGFSVNCAGEGWREIAERLTEVQATIRLAQDVSALALAVMPLVRHLETRPTGAAAHAQALADIQADLSSSSMYRKILTVIGAERAEQVTVLLFVMADYLSPSQRAEVGTLDEALGERLSHVRSQFAALQAAAH